MRSTARGTTGTTKRSVPAAAADFVRKTASASFRPAPMKTLVLRVLFPDAVTQRRLATLLVLVLLVFFVLGTRSFAWHFSPRPPFDKLAHIVVFGAFAALVLLATGARLWWLGPAAVVALGLLDETLQRHTPGRDADLSDVAADLVGALAAVALLHFLRRLYARRLALAATGREPTPPPEGR